MTSIVPYSDSDEKLSEIEEQALVKLRALIDASGDHLLINNKAEATDSNLLMYLRCRKYKVESAFTKLQNMMHARKYKYSDVFSTLYPSKYYKAFDRKMAGVLENRDAHGRHVCVAKIALWNPSELYVEEVIKAGILLGFEALQHKETQLNGVVLVLDTRGFGLKMARQANPILIHKYLDLYMHSYPIKIKAVHICHGSRVFNMTLSFVKSFLPKKLSNRIHTHGGDLSSLYEFISPDILPDTFGGRLTEEEAIDDDFRLNMYTQKAEDYYKSLIENCEKL